MTTDERTLNEQALGVYLRDHHAGATAGTALARQISEHHEETMLANETAALAAEIAEDMQTLESIMTVLDIPASTVKDLAAAVGHRIMQLKSHAVISEPRTLSRLIELETLSAGITGKAALWRSLQTVSATDQRLPEFDFASLIERAYNQRDRVDACHRSWVTATLTESAAST